MLIDAGAGRLFGPTLGKLVANLKAAGYQPEQVDEIYITHMHPDHVGGLTAGGKRVFPNAVVRADKRDADFWLSQAKMDKAPDGREGLLPGRDGVAQAVRRRRQVQAVRRQRPSSCLACAPIADLGHTPGHTIYVGREQGPEARRCGAT